MARIIPLPKNCELCNKVFETLDSRKRFCNKSCSAVWNNLRRPKKIVQPKKNLVQKWLDGEWNGSTKDGLSRTVRKFLMEEANYICQDGRSGCGGWSGTNPKTGKTCLTVDHRDGNSQNNSRDNLIVMCPNCHSMTLTYGALNKGNGRKNRYVAVTQLVE